jgi:hypothetical protein
MEIIKTKTSPLLRAAILSAISSEWITHRELSQRIEGYAQGAIRVELWHMFADGLLQKRSEAIPPRGSSPRPSYYRLPESISSDTA